MFFLAFNNGPERVYSGISRVKKEHNNHNTATRRKNWEKKCACCMNEEMEQMNERTNVQGARAKLALIHYFLMNSQFQKK